MRILIKSIVFILLITIAGLIALPFVVNPNDYKQLISDEVEKATGRNLIIEGDIGLSVFPWIALELGSLSLSNAPSFKADTFAKVDAAHIRIKLMPLLKKQLEMDTIVLDGLTLNLETNKTGQTNWDDLVGAGSSTKSDTSATQQDSKPALAAISIAGIKMTNANIIWSDLSKSEHYQLENLNLNTDPLVMGEPTDIDVNFRLISEKPSASADITLSTQLIVDLKNQRYAMTNLELSTATQAQASSLPFTQADITLSGDINADMVSQLLTIDNLSLRSNISNTDQSIEAQLSTHISSNLNNQQIALQQLELAAEIIDPTLPNGKAKLSLTTDITADMKQQTITLSGLVLNTYDVLINADIKATNFLSADPAFSGQFNINPFNLRQLANNLAVELPIMSDDSTLEFIKLDSSFSGSSKHIDLNKIELALDQSNLKGSFSVTNFAKPAMKFALTLDELDADRYLPPATEKQASPPPASGAAAAATELPLETLRQINAKGSLDIGKLKISGMYSEKIHLEINGDNGLIHLSPLSANLYQGHYQGNVTLDARGKTLKLALDEKLQNIQAGPLLKDLTGDDAISGSANAQVKLTGNGANIDQIKQTLTGNGQFSFTDGALKGINIAESIRKAKATLKGQKIAASNEPVKTDFSALSGSFKASNGIINNQDLLAMTPLLRINGAGTIDLPKEVIDYGLKVSIVTTSKGQGGEELADLKGLTIPVKIAGTFSQPKPSVDLASILKDKASQELKTKVADELSNKLGSDVGSLLNGVLGQPAPTAEATEPSQPESEPQVEQPVPSKSPEDQAKDILKDKLKSFF